MSFLTYLFGRSTSPVDEPWTARSAYESIRSNIDAGTGRLQCDQVQLPDEDEIAGGMQIRWAPGAMDGVFGHHSSPEHSKATVTRLARLVDKIARTGDTKSIAAAYAMMKEESALSLIDPMIEGLRERGTPIEPHLAAFALKLATQSADRGPVKVGIALLGAAKLTQHREVVETLGLHEEFTLFSAVALRNMLEDAEAALWQLACKVNGWGRIQVVERLVPTDNERIQHWLRTEGFRNSILYEYLALIAAEHGKLRDSLERPSVPDAELRAAGEIIAAMIAADGGPGAGINAYADAGATCLAYLEHVDRAAPDVDNFISVHALAGYLEHDGRSSSERLANGWSESVTARAMQLVRALLARPVWDALIREGLDAADPMIFHRASDAAVKAGIDPYPWHWKRLLEQPGSSGAWHLAMRHMNPERIDAALDLAARHLPLREIAAGPADEMGFGSEFEMHRCLDAVLQELKDYPGRGSGLIAAGLLSPVVRNRNLALNALEAWDAHQWTEELRQALERARSLEVHDALSQRMSRLAKSGAARG